MTYSFIDPTVLLATLGRTFGRACARKQNLVYLGYSTWNFIGDENRVSMWVLMGWLVIPCRPQVRCQLSSLTAP
ncbi:uncharacterized protein N7500_002768 [Penicillium coprophilum]|uniref:uncharacterized protein n=1 Tax=Penicillium coprophilum TaxID=36646 RepID=UPI00239989DC|nr:uncharacterized protein N7500_002768 [Penicillium coprophilum]KAJ5169985.1 hypothetical protein N7500_002768 [Penicillium coprophilum]